jgi:hypothetical protein
MTEIIGKPKITTDLEAKAAAAQSGLIANPVFTCCGGAAYEAVRSLRLFMGEATEAAKLQFSELPKEDRDAIVNDAYLVISGHTPPQLYDSHNTTGITWAALDPVEKTQWVLFCGTVLSQLQAIQHVATAAQQGMDAAASNAEGEANDKVT